MSNSNPFDALFAAIRGEGNALTTRRAAELLKEGMQEEPERFGEFAEQYVAFFSENEYFAPLERLAILAVASDQDTVTTNLALAIGNKELLLHQYRFPNDFGPAMKAYTRFKETYEPAEQAQ